MVVFTPGDSDDYVRKQQLQYLEKRKSRKREEEDRRKRVRYNLAHHYKHSGPPQRKTCEQCGYEGERREWWVDQFSLPYPNALVNAKLVEPVDEAGTKLPVTVYVFKQCPQCGAKTVFFNTEKKPFPLVERWFKRTGQDRIVNFNLLSQRDKHLHWEGFLEDFEQLMSDLIKHPEKDITSKIEEYKQVFLRSESNLPETFKVLADAISNEFKESRKSPFQSVIALMIASLMSKTMQILAMGERDSEVVKTLVAKTIEDHRQESPEAISNAIIRNLKQNRLLGNGTPSQTDLSYAETMRRMADQLTKWANLTKEQRNSKTEIIDYAKFFENASLIEGIISGILLRYIKEGKISGENGNLMFDEIKESIVKAFQTLKVQEK